jgi:hypothetical protein
MEKIRRKNLIYKLRNELEAEEVEQERKEKIRAIIYNVNEWNKISYEEKKKHIEEYIKSKNIKSKTLISKIMNDMEKYIDSQDIEFYEKIINIGFLVINEEKKTYYININE